MNLTIDLSDDIATQLEDEAHRRGVDARQCAAQIIRENLPAVERAKAMRSLFNQWAKEDATSDPAEIARRQGEWEELKNALNANRNSGRRLFAE